MKTKLFLLLALILVVSSHVYADLMQPSNLKIGVEDNSTRNVVENAYRNVPDFSFDVLPLNIITTYYDYFPGSYESIPIRVQPSPVGGFAGGGVYIAFQGRPAAGGVRRVYYTYIEDGSITSTSYIDLTTTAAEGFPGIDIDLETGNPFVAWHTASPTNPQMLHVPITFDQYNLIGVPGLWNAPYGVLDNPYNIGEEENQEFIWPSVFVGPSPHAGMRRVYVIGKNYVSNVHGNPCENSLIAFADFSDPTDLSIYDETDWTYLTIPHLDHWRNQNVRPFRATITSRTSGRIAIVGHTSDLEEGSGAFSPNDVLFILENNSYGEGEWYLNTATPTIPVQNPQNYFIGEGNNPYQDMRYGPYVNRHNAVVDAQGNYHFLSVYTLSTEENTWFPYFSTVKHVKYEVGTGEFSINDLYPRSDDGSMYLPWDNPPQFDNNGNLNTYVSWPYYWWDAEDVFHENYYRLATRGNVMVALFQESVKARLFHHAGDDQYANWASAPETYIMVSGDFGENWSEPIILSSIDTPELSGTIPAYWYISDHIEDLGDDWGKIHLFFLDQTDYGSFVQGNSPESGGRLMYTSMNIDFSDFGGFSSVEENVSSLKPQMLRQNYPNPFNPSTTIAYSLPADSEVRIDVYNVKGQLVKTLVDGYVSAGDNYVVWNGRDNSNREVASGLYFYKLSTGAEVETRKMILVK